MAKDYEHDEVEMRLETSDDARTVTLIFKSTSAMDTYDLVVAIEAFVQEVLLAQKQRDNSNGKTH